MDESTTPDGLAIADLLSAYLDDELDGDERALVAASLAESAALRSDLAGLEATRRLLRSLPDVEPPIARADAGSPVVGLEPARRRRHRAMGRGLVAAAACTALLLGVGAAIDSPPIAPDVEAMAQRHGGDPLGFVVADAGAMDDPAVLDDLGGAMPRAAVYRSGDMVQAVYSDGAHDVSIFHEPGAVDWGALPAGGSTMEMPAGPAWQGEMDDAVVLVVERGDLVVTVVSDADMGGEDAAALAMEVSEMVPPVRHHRSWWDRLQDAPRNLFDRI